MLQGEKTRPFRFNAWITRETALRGSISIDGWISSFYVTQHFYDTMGRREDKVSVSEDSAVQPLLLTD